MLTFRHIGIAIFSGLFVAASVAVCQTVATGNSQRNTLSYYDPGMVKTMHAYGPLFSDYIAHENTESAAPNDFVEKFQVPDGSEVRVLVKVPAPAEPSKILRVPPIPPGTTANEYFANAISEAISGGYAAVIFPTATYNFVVPAPSSGSHLLIKGAKDLVIDGRGSTLNFASPVVAGVTIDHSQRIVFKGFNIDWPNVLMASVGTIVSIDKQSNPHTMKVQIGSQYSVDKNTQIYALSPWDATTDPGNPHFALKNFQKEEYPNNKRTVYLGNNTFEVPYWNTQIAAGDVVLVRHFGGAPYKNAIKTGGSYDLDFEHVNIYASPYMGFLLSGGGGYRLSHCSVTRRNAARLISSSADAVHIADNTGDIIIEDSTFAYQGDDGLNIHGAMAGSPQAGENFLHWTGKGENSYAPYSWTANDVIGFFDNTLGFHGVKTFQSLSHPQAGLQINLKDAAPNGATQVEDLSRASARFVLRNNQYLYNRARGVLLNSSYGLVENNSFIGQTKHGILLNAEADDEGPGVQNVVFRENRFSNVGSFPPNPNEPSGAFVVDVKGNAANATSTVPVHENLILDSNTFSDLQGPGLFVARANDVVVTNNRFTNTNLSRSKFSDVGTANLGGSVVITRAHKVFISKSSTQGATTGPLSIDTKSTDGIKH
jgi:hypothetical protein